VSARTAIAGAVLLGASLGSGAASAQYRLRADAYFSAADPVSGLVILSGEAHKSWLSADTVLWLGPGGDHVGDVMVASVRARDPDGYGEARIGRMMVTAGALRPIHLDGIDATGRAPWGTSVEVFGGLPVVSDFQPRDYDWAAGGRVAQRISQYATVGVSYLQMRQYGAVAYEELGLDTSVQPTRWLDAAFNGAVDMQAIDLADARLSLAGRFSKVRVELFAVRRSPSHLLPATSLFSALGDVPSERAGGSILWRPAPRLDLLGEGSAESLGGLPGAQALLRATLRLDDKGKGAVGLEGRRESTPGASWTGIRGTARVPLSRLFGASTELELVMPDEPRARGSVWPWGLVALRFTPHKSWELSGAMEASSSPTAVASLSGLFRASYTWRSR
jgi:hypothetical protein